MISINKRRLSFRNFQLTGLVVIFLCFWLPVIVFSKLANEVLEGDPIGVDSAILHAVHDHTSQFYNSFFVAVSALGSAAVISPLVGLAAAYLLYKRINLKAIVLLVGVGGAAFANLVLKLLFQRQRPDLWTTIVTENSYSFPSGHAMASSALALCVMLLLWHTKWRIAAIVAGSAYILLVGLSRVYLGVHFPSDIVAGWMVSTVWVLLVSSLISDFPFRLRSKLRRVFGRLRDSSD